MFDKTIFERKESSGSKTGKPLTFWLSQPRILTNLLAMTVIWSVATFDLFLILFMLTSFGQIFVTSFIFGLGSIAISAASGPIFKRFGVKQTQRIGLSLASVCGALLLFLGTQMQGYYLVPVLVMGAKIGNGLSMSSCLISNSHLFPTLFAVSALGLCNFIAKSLTILAPIVAQLEEPLPMLLFTGSSIVALASVQLLQVPENGNPDELLELKVRQ